MSKEIDLNKPVYDLIKDCSEVAAIMKVLGFESITNPAMLNTVGRIMTVKKGAAMKNIDMNAIREAFISKGFVIKE